MRKMNCREVIVKMIDGTTIHGKTNIGNTRRLSDVFNTKENAFLVVFDARLHDSDERVVFLNKNHIVCAIPVGDAVSVQCHEDDLRDLEVEVADTHIA